jgi:hypothetical protein
MRYAVKYVAIPLILLTTYILVVQGDQMLGRAYDVRPEGKFEFVDYRVIVDKGIKRIELWVIQENKSRLHLIPYSEKTENQLAKAKTRKKNGQRERGEFGAPGKDKKGDRDDLSIADIPLEEILTPKIDEEAPENKGLTPEELRDKRNSLSTT